MKQELLILQGIPASGKTTWAKEFMKGKEDWVRVNRDELRRMRGDYWIPSQESFITKLEDYAVSAALVSGYNVLIDATNLNKHFIQRWYDIADTYRTEITFKFFDIDLNTAIERDSNRTEPVGKDVITKFHKNYIETKEYIFSKTK